MKIQTVEVVCISEVVYLRVWRWRTEMGLIRLWGTVQIQSIRRTLWPVTDAWFRRIAGGGVTTWRFRQATGELACFSVQKITELKAVINDGRHKKIDIKFFKRHNFAFSGPLRISSPARVTYDFAKFRFWTLCDAWPTNWLNQYSIGEPWSIYFICLY